MMNKKILVLVSALGFCVAGSAFANDGIDCQNAKYSNRDECVRNKDECVRAKANVNHRNDAVDCGNAANGNKDECVRAKANVNHRNDTVKCGNAANGNKDECARTKFNIKHG